MKTYFGLEVTPYGVRMKDIEALPFGAFWRKSARGSTGTIDPDTGEYMVYLDDWENFCRLFIETGQSRYSTPSPQTDPNDAPVVQEQPTHGYQDDQAASGSSLVHARVPGEIQDIASQVIQASGLTVSDVVRVLMNRIAQDKAIPSVLFQPNTETLAAFSEVERGDLKRFEAVDALFDDLHGVATTEPLP